MPPLPMYVSGFSEKTEKGFPGGTSHLKTACNYDKINKIIAEQKRRT